WGGGRWPDVLLRKLCPSFRCFGGGGQGRIELRAACSANPYLASRQLRNQEVDKWLRQNREPRQRKTLRRQHLLRKESAPSRICQNTCEPHWGRKARRWPRKRKSLADESSPLMTCDIRIGTSGYHYKHWRGPFYPPKISSDEMLEFYSQQFNTVELNNSFYRLP